MDVCGSLQESMFVYLQAELGGERVVGRLGDSGDGVITGYGKVDGRTGSDPGA